MEVYEGGFTMEVYEGLTMEVYEGGLSVEV